MKKLETFGKYALASALLFLANPLSALARSRLCTLFPSLCLGPDDVGIPAPVAPFSGPAGQSTVTGFAVQIIDIFLVIVGFVTVLMIIIAGFRYVTSAGNEELAEGAKKNLQHAILGLVIVILSFVIVRVIANALATTNPT